MRPEDRIPSNITNLIQSRAGKGSASVINVVSRIEQQIVTRNSCLLRMELASIAIHSAGRIRDYLLVTARVVQSKRQSAGVIDNRTDLNSAHNLVNKSIYVRKQQF